MNTRLKVQAAAVAVGAALVLAPASSATQPHVAADHGHRVTQFDVALRDFDKNYVDVGTSGPGVGDLLVFQDRVLRRGTQSQVGVQGGSCTVTAVMRDGFQTHCVGTVSLRNGQISFQGLVTDAPRKVMAVIGGTGSYEGAAGTLILVENGDGTNSGQDDGTGTLRIELLQGVR